MNQSIRLLTNIKDFPKEWTSTSGVHGTTRTLASAWQFLKNSRGCDAILINCDPRLIYTLTTLYLFFPRRRKPIFGLDLVLRRPVTLGSKLARPFTRFLLGRVEHFIHYFRDLAGYEKYFGIGPARSSYVPFKSGVLDRSSFVPSLEGSYVVCVGRSERDFDTFFKMMSRVPYPGVIPEPDALRLKQNSSRFTVPSSAIPANVRMLPDDGSFERAVEIISRARVVTLPIKAHRISASGISTYLMAMASGKCVIITEGPGSSDVLKDEALFVPAEDPDALATAVRRVWEDAEVRQRVAAAGKRYALGCGTTKDLYQRVVEIIAVKDKLGSLTESTFAHAPSGR